MNNNETVKISKDLLTQLMSDSIKLDILESDGVDNWTWYMEGLNTYVKDFLNDHPDFKEWFGESVEEDDIDYYYIDYDTIASFIVETKY